MNTTTVKQDIFDHYTDLQNLWDLSWKIPENDYKDACIKSFIKTFASPSEIKLLLGE